MIHLKKYREKRALLQDVMPFGRILYLENGAGVCVLKDGAFLSSLRYRGPDLDSAIEETLAWMTGQMNSLLLTLGTGWVLYAEAQRAPSVSYDSDVCFPDAVTKAIDEERRKNFQSGQHFENSYYLSLYWMPPADTISKLKNFFVEGAERTEASTDAAEYIEDYTKQLALLFASCSVVGMPETEWLGPDDLLSYLYSTISLTHVPLKLPKNPILLDGLLYDTPLYGGMEPRLGAKYLAAVSPVKYPDHSSFGMLNILNTLPFSYRFITRFYFLDKQDALGEIKTFARGWRSKVKPFTATIKELLTGFAGNEVNENAVEKVEEIRAMEQLVESDTVGCGYYSAMLLLADQDKIRLQKCAEEIVQLFTNMEQGSIAAKVEGMHTLEAYFGSIPGNVYYGIRRPMLSTGNLIHLLPITDIWAGKKRNEHLKAPVLLYTKTGENTSFRLNLHVGDVGHTMLIGPTGAGKSVHLNLIAAQFRKYKDARIFIFDKGGSSRILTEAVGGNFFDLGNETELSFQPLRQIDDEKERMWAAEWIYDFLRQENVTITPEIKKHTWTALSSMAALPEGYRTISTLKTTVQDKLLKDALVPLTIEGAYGKMFDSAEERLAFSSWQTFEMETLMNTPAILSPALMYIFHRIEQALDGRPTLIDLDECWIFFDNPTFAGKIREWLKVLRKSNASVIFATQSLADIVDTPIFSTILESCPSRIFLPNKNAFEERSKKLYRAFGLNDRQLQILTQATPKKEYYYVSELGCRLYDLDLEREALAYCAVNKQDLIACKGILAEYGKANFVQKWREYKGLQGETA